MGLFDKFFSLFKKKKDEEPIPSDKEKSKPKEIEEILETSCKLALMYYKKQNIKLKNIIEELKLRPGGEIFMELRKEFKL